MMMKLVTLLFVTLLSTVLGAPAVVWKNGQQLQEQQQQRFLHSSESISASDLMVNALESEAPEASLSVVFLVSKGEDGSEQLSELASSGKLPQTSQKYQDATSIYHHVAGIESTSTVVRHAASTTGDRVLEVSIKELNSKLNAFATPTEMEVDSTGNSKPASKSSGKRARDLAKANVLVVPVSAKEDVSEVDAAISSAIDNEHVNSVVLAGIRSIHEVKHERYLISKRKMLAMEQEGNKLQDSRRRRLEQQDGQANDDAVNNNNQNEEMSGVYYVSMTPNIFSGLLFLLLFIVIAYTGISCMGSIQGGDTFTDKMPSIGREA